MNRLDFLSMILPTGDKYCVVGLAKSRGHTRQVFLDSIEEVDAWAIEQASSGIDAFYSPASYIEGTKRVLKNVAQFKSVWLDLDIGPDTEFEDQAAGLIALKAFVKIADLPKPTIVSSGYGMHVYWVFDEAVDYNVWKPLATALKQRVEMEGFKIKDSFVTIDAVRILRIPGTKNFKFGQETEVKVLLEGPQTPVLELKQVLNAGALSALNLMDLGSTNQGLSETAKALMGNIIYKFSRIMQKSATGSGCAQMLNIYANQEDLIEYLWRAGLSIAQFCEDRASAIQKISYRYAGEDGYDPIATEKKAAEIKGPYTCIKFRELNPLLCEGCKHWGQLSTPLLLGKDILEATPTDNIITAISPELGSVDIEVPEYPYPYFRGPKGGIYIKKALDDLEEGELDKSLVYENDLYVVGRRTDPDSGEVIHMRLIRPHDGISDFTAPLATVTASDKCRDMLSQRGVAAHTKQMSALLSYLVAWTKHLQNSHKAELVRVQFGWNDGHNAFVIGSREYSKNNPPMYSPPSTSTESIVPIYSKAGELSEWTKVANTYALPGNEIRAFALFLSLGSPMFKAFELGGAIVHLTNAASGVGKSTIQKLANSVWAHPDKAMLTKDDKTLAKYHRMGVIQNMVLCIDELTNMPPEEVSDLAFGVTNGRGRNRMQGSSNAERINNTTWSLPCITSGNNSLHEVLQIVKAAPEGELMRVLELEVVRRDGLSKKETDKLFSKDLMGNYGHAGEVMVQYMLDNYEECVKEMFAMQVEFDNLAGFAQKERYYSALCATAIWGGTVANKLGLVNIPVQPVITALARHFGRDIEIVDSTVDQSGSNLGTFMSEYIQNQLIINKTPPAIEGMLSAPIETPRGALVIRREPDVQRAYIIASILKSWCAKKQISYSNLVADLAETGILIDIKKVRMSAGTPQDSPAVMALVLDSSKIF